MSCGGYARMRFYLEKKQRLRTDDLFARRAWGPLTSFVFVVPQNTQMQMCLLLLHPLLSCFR
jgi:hypothetical protein